MFRTILQFLIIPALFAVDAANLFTLRTTRHKDLGVRYALVVIFARCR